MQHMRVRSEIAAQRLRKLDMTNSGWPLLWMAVFALGAALGRAYFDGAPAKVGEPLYSPSVFMPYLAQPIIAALAALLVVSTMLFVLRSLGRCSEEDYQAAFEDTEAPRELRRFAAGRLADELSARGADKWARVWRGRQEAL